MIEELSKKLYEKITKEYKEFINSVQKKEPKEIIKMCYEISIKEEFLDMFYNPENFNKYELLALLNEDNTLNFLYNDWMNSDNGIHTVIQENAEIGITDLATDYVREQKDKISDDPNLSLFDDIANSLNDFDNFGYCRHLKDKCGLDTVDDIENIDIYNLFYSNGGKRYLYDTFLDLKNNRDLQYLNETQVIDSNNYNNINDKILPRLKEIIKEENDKSKRNKERDER